MANEVPKQSSNNNTDMGMEKCTESLTTVDENGVVIKLCSKLLFLAQGQYHHEGLEAASPTFNHQFSIPNQIAVCMNASTHNSDNPISMVCEPYARKENYQVRPRNPKS